MVQGTFEEPGKRKTHFEEACSGNYPIDIRSIFTIQKRIQNLKIFYKAVIPNVGYRGILKQLYKSVFIFRFNIIRDDIYWETGVNLQLKLIIISRNDY